MKILSLLLFFTLMILYNGCAQHPSPQTTQTPVVDTRAPGILSDSMVDAMKKEKEMLVAKMAAAQITHFIIKAPGDRFGYTVFIDGQMYIEQVTIPAVEGIRGFATQEDAEKVAQLVIRKIKEGEMPPSLTPAELTALGISLQ
ncbi:MAG: DUF4907 domain-containing protein [Bacteroidota bacterium]|nr:DUF4907 domain-containing protein [Bacteroidota bacterium]